MGDTASVQLVFNGSRRAIYKLTSVSDGSGENAVKKVDLTDLEDSHYGVPSEVLIYSIQYVVYGMAVSLLWEGASSNKVIMTLEGHDRIDFAAQGGLRNDATSPTGNILLTTVGAAANASYTIVLELIEHYEGDQAVVVPVFGTNKFIIRESIRATELVDIEDLTWFPAVAEVVGVREAHSVVRVHQLSATDGVAIVEDDSAYLNTEAIAEEVVAVAEETTGDLIINADSPIEIVTAVEVVEASPPA